MKKQKTSKKILTIFGLLFLGMIIGVSAYTLYEDLNMDGNGIYNVTAIESEGEGIRVDSIIMTDYFETEDVAVFGNGFTLGVGFECVGSGVIDICSEENPVEVIYLESIMLWDSGLNDYVEYQSYNGRLIGR